MVPAEVPNILRKTSQEEGPVAQPRSHVSEKPSARARAPAPERGGRGGGGTHAHLQTQLLSEGQQSRAESKSYFGKGEVSDVRIDVRNVRTLS